MQNNILSISGLILATMLLWASCKKPEASVTPPPPDNEYLTTVKIVAVNRADSNDVVTATWVDLTPDDLNPPDTSNAILNLRANSVYDAKVFFLDETQSPPGDITAEIKDRQNYHLIFFQPTPVAPADTVSGVAYTTIPGTPASPNGPYLNLHVARTDLDNNNPPLPIGLTDKFTTGAASSGHLEVLVRHQPDGKNGTYAPGSVDGDVTFRVTIN